MTSALVTNIVSNKYIVSFQKICALQDNNNNYNKIRLKNNFDFRKKLNLKYFLLFLSAIGMQQKD